MSHAHPCHRHSLHHHRHLPCAAAVAGAYARAPLCERVGALDVATVSFIYGTSDWMDHRAAEALARDARTARVGGGAARSVAVEVCRVAGAGHNLQLDNPLGFVEAVLASGGGGGGGGFDGRVFGEAALRAEAAWQAAQPQDLAAAPSGTVGS